MNKIMFFAHLKDIAGQEQLTMDASEQTVGELKQKLSQQYDFHNLESVMTAINEEFADDGEIIKKGDTIAFIPPVSGG